MKPMFSICRTVGTIWGRQSSVMPIQHWSGCRTQPSTRVEVGDMNMSVVTSIPYTHGQKRTRWRVVPGFTRLQYLGCFGMETRLWGRIESFGAIFGNKLSNICNILKSVIWLLILIFMYAFNYQSVTFWSSERLSQLLHEPQFSRIRTRCSFG